MDIILLTSWTLDIIEENAAPKQSIEMWHAEAPVRSEFLSLLRISEFFGFQWQKLAEILSLFKLYNNLGKVAVRVKLWLIIYCGHLVEWIVK